MSTNESDASLLGCTKICLHFESGLRMIWSKFLSGDVVDHVHIVEGEDDRGTLEIELDAKEEKRRDKKQTEGNSLMMMSSDYDILH